MANLFNGLVSSTCSPEEAQAMWEALAATEDDKPSARKVANRLTEQGRRVTWATVNKWRKNGWKRMDVRRPYNPHVNLVRTIVADLPIFEGKERMSIEQIEVAVSCKLQYNPILKCELEKSTDSALLTEAARECLILTCLMMDIAKNNLKRMATKDPDSLGRLLVNCAKAVEICNDPVMSAQNFRERSAKNDPEHKTIEHIPASVEGDPMSDTIAKFDRFRPSA